MSAAIRLEPEIPSVRPQPPTQAPAWIGAACAICMLLLAVLGMFLSNAREISQIKTTQEDTAAAGSIFRSEQRQDMIELRQDVKSIIRQLPRQTAGLR